jgi:hypothetical protein
MNSGIHLTKSGIKKDRNGINSFFGFNPIKNWGFTA